MNFQVKDTVQDWELNPSIYFPHRQVSFAENSITKLPKIEWTRTAPNKVIVATSECDWLLEDNNKFHFSESN